MSYNYACTKPIEFDNLNNSFINTSKAFMDIRIGSLVATKQRPTQSLGKFTLLST